jgi:short-subunit dehydrogenase
VKGLVVGASGGLGRALAEHLAAAGWDLVITGTQPRDLEAIAADLSLRFATSVHPISYDFLSDKPEQLVADVRAKLGVIQGLFMVSGFGDPDRDLAKMSDTLITQLVTINFLGPARLANVFLNDLTINKSAVLLGIGSVASIRPRAVNSIYGASKLALEFRFRALGTALRGSGCRVQFYRMGYLDTRMLEGRWTLLPKARPSAAAAHILRKLDRPNGTYYYPQWWWYVGLLLRLLPPIIFRHIRG